MKAPMHPIGGTALDNWGCRLLLGGLMLCCLAVSVNARAADEVEVSLVAEVREELPALPGTRRVVRFMPATSLHQGQEIFYTVRIRNPAVEPATDVEVMQRIPANTNYVPNSAAGPGVDIDISADGGLTFAKEGQLTVVDQSALALMQATNLDRAALTRPARPTDYTTIRWRLRDPLAPGAVALARFRAVFR